MAIDEILAEFPVVPEAAILKRKPHIFRLKRDDDPRCLAGELGKRSWSPDILKYSHFLVLVLSLLALPLGLGARQNSDYKVGVGDILHVTVLQDAQMSGDFQVSENGTISYPLLGDVIVRDKAVSEVSAFLEKALEKDYFVDVQLSVEVREYHSRPVTVLGAVVRPGTYFLNGETTLVDLIAEAGGLGASAGPQIELRRESAEGTEDARVLSFSTGKVMSGEDGGSFYIEAGDVISVSAKQLFFITGEVRSPGQYEIARGLTLMQALSKAGGKGKFASQKIEIHRDIQGKKQILEFDIRDIRKGKAKDPTISAGDVIIVKRRFF